jgi:hypothetical protein
MDRMIENKISQRCNYSKATTKPKILNLSSAIIFTSFFVCLLLKAKEMIKGIRQAFKENVNSLTWMDRKTKLAVSEKVFDICLIYLFHATDCIRENGGSCR